MKATLGRLWRRAAYGIGHLQTRLVLIAFYAVVVTPFALALRLFSDPLRLRIRPGQSNWLSRQPRAASLEDGWRQF